MDLPGPIHDFLLVFLGLVLILGGFIPIFRPRTIAQPF